MSANASCKMLLDTGRAAAAATVGVCVITYKRPKGLHRCLQSLQLLQFRLSSTPHISIFVVDNDPSASAQPIVQQLQTLSKWPITYDVEPTRGISYARNRAVSLAKDCDFIAFIDDDEYATPSGWMSCWKPRDSTTPTSSQAPSSQSSRASHLPGSSTAGSLRRGGPKPGRRSARRTPPTCSSGGKC